MNCVNEGSLDTTQNQNFQQVFKETTWFFFLKACHLYQRYSYNDKLFIQAAFQDFPRILGGWRNHSNLELYIRNANTIAISELWWGLSETKNIKMVVNVAVWSHWYWCVSLNWAISNLDLIN